MPNLTLSPPHNYLGHGFASENLKLPFDAKGQGLGLGWLGLGPLRLSCKGPIQSTLYWPKCVYTTPLEGPRLPPLIKGLGLFIVNSFLYNL